MSEKVEIEIKAKDEASESINKVGKALSTGLKVGLAGVAVAGAAMAGALAWSVGQAMEAEKVQAQLDAVLKSTGGAAGMTADAVNDLATQLSQVTPYEDDAITAGESMLLTFTNIGADVFPMATQAMLDMSTATGQDLQGSAVQLGKALNDPIAGISALSRVGVTFTEDQKAVIQALVETGDVAGAQTIILDELNKEFGGSAQAAGQTFSGQLQILKNSIGNVGESIGGALLPMLTTLASNISGFVQNDQFQAWITNVTTWISTNLPIAIAWLANVWTTVLQPAITTVWTWLSTVLIPFLQNTVFPWLQTYIPIALQFLSDVWTNVLQPAINAVWTWLSTVLIPFLQNTVVPWLQVYVPIALQALSDFWTNVLQPAIQAVWGWISGTLIPFFQNTVVPILQVVIPAALQVLANFWQNILKPAIQIVWGFIQGSVIPLLTTLGQLISVTLGVAITALTGLWQNVLLPALRAVWSFISSTLGPIFQTISDKLSNTLGPALTTATGFINTLKGAFSGVSDAISGVIGWIQGLIDKISNIELPDWLTPGSPTPFELGLRGIADAMKEVEKSSAVFGMSINGRNAPLTPIGQAVTNNYYNMNYQGNSRRENIVMDFNLLKTQTRT